MIKYEVEDIGGFIGGINYYRIKITKKNKSILENILGSDFSDEIGSDCFFNNKDKILIIEAFEKYNHDFKFNKKFKKLLD